MIALAGARRTVAAAERRQGFGVWCATTPGAGSPAQELARAEEFQHAATWRSRLIALSQVCEAERSCRTQSMTAAHRRRIDTQLESIPAPGSEWAQKSSGHPRFGGSLAGPRG